jgi:hypothetical protein
VSYVAEVLVVGITLPAEPTVSDKIVTVLYCDTCRRWGRPGTTHLCGDTWAQKLGDLLITLLAEQT